MRQHKLARHSLADAPRRRGLAGSKTRPFQSTVDPIRSPRSQASEIPSCLASPEKKGSEAQQFLFGERPQSAGA